MKKEPPYLVTFILILSCEKVDKVCNCSNPLEDLPWLKEIKASFTIVLVRYSIFQAAYNKQTVFYSLMNDPLCNSFQQINLYDCSGNNINTFNSTDSGL